MTEQKFEKIGIVEYKRSNISRAAELLEQDGLVSFPTETVYGLGARAASDKGVARIFDAKQRPAFNPLIVHVSGLDMAEEIVEFSHMAYQLVAALWPGSLTLVLPKRKKAPVSELVSAGLDTVAVRQPAHPMAMELLKECDFAIAAPSANASGTISPTLPLHVQQSLGDRVDMIIDGGACRVGLESTVVGFNAEGLPVLFRPGGVPVETIEKVLGGILRPEKDPSLPKSPGQLASHYAPRLPMRLNATDKQDGEAFLGFGQNQPFFDLNLSEKGDLVEAAANLFAMMRRLDDKRFTRIAVAPVPVHGLGLAINDRLQRAAAMRNKDI